jgi:hypothetical protein
MRLLHLHPSRSSQAQSLLLQLPVELLLEISDWLPSASAVALALTCTSLFGPIFPRNRLQGPQLEDLLRLLERDLSKQLFFCQPCQTLHRFSQWWKPGYEDKFNAPCKPMVTVYDTFYVRFHLARLAMNKHLLGGGLSLEQLAGSFNVSARRNSWEINFTARIIQDELFLSVSHTLSLTGTGADNCRALQSHDHGICHHLTTHPPRTRLKGNSSAMPYRQWVQGRHFYAKPQRLMIPELGPEDSQRLRKYQDVQGSCYICLTDYSITTRRRVFNCVDEPTKVGGFDLDPYMHTKYTNEAWDIIIIAYHQLGPCRSQFDWKWLTYATELPAFTQDDLDVQLLAKRCENGPYAQGSVRARWDAV